MLLGFSAWLVATAAMQLQSRAGWLMAEKILCPQVARLFRGASLAWGAYASRNIPWRWKTLRGGNLTQSSCVPCSVCCGFATENSCLTIFYYFSMSFFCQIFLGSVSWKKFWVELDSTNPTIYILSKPWRNFMEQVKRHMCRAGALFQLNVQVWQLLRKSPYCTMEVSLSSSTEGIMIVTCTAQISSSLTHIGTRLFSALVIQGEK